MAKWWRRLGQGLAIALGIWVLLDVAAYAAAEVLWFQELDYLQALGLRFQTQAILWLIGGGGSAVFLLGNLWLARRWRDSQPIERSERAQPHRTPPLPTPTSTSTLRADILARRRQIAEIDKPLFPRRSRPLSLSLRPLLALLLLLGLLLGGLILHYTLAATAYWQPDLSLPKVTPPLPSAFNLSALVQLWIDVPGWQLYGQLLAITVVGIGLLMAHGWLLSGLAVLLSLVLGFCLAGNWTRVLEFWQATPFERADPMFSLDMGVYIFRLPLWELVAFWWSGLMVYSLVATTLIYLLAGDSISQGKFPGFSRPQLRHLEFLGGLLAGVLSLRHAIACFSLVYSERGVTYGASYTDIHVQLPLEIALSVIVSAAAVGLLLSSLVGRSPVGMLLSRRFRQPIAPLWSFLSIAYLLVFVTSQSGALLVQNLVVSPNELERERPYIERSIAQTRAAFALDRIDAQTFRPQGNLTLDTLAQNELTVENIRLWDTRPLLEANRQLQEIRSYYRFWDADIDRYTLKLRPTEPSADPVTRKRQVLISPRELDYEQVPDDAKTWVNEHLVYTHGYGFTLSPVNQAENGGLPPYFVRDIGTETGEGDLRLSDQVVAGSIPIARPRIYYGELTNAYVMTSTMVKELDFPSGGGNALNVYDGGGGIAIGATWRRLAFAKYLRDWQMLLTRNFTAETQLLMRRNINARVRAIAPFLRYDSDPYIVNVDTGEASVEEADSHLYWILDAYTTSARYPYSDPGDRAFNYIRNSVKVVVDAYNGDVDFYITDPNDPMIRTWQKILPGFFQPLAAMPTTLQGHIRYPTDLFSAQSERLLLYHMTEPRVFYNREDLWQVPQEIYADEPQPVNPYHLIVRFPGETTAEFVLLHPYSPTARPNLVAWLAARSDGDRYGKLLLYQFPKQTLVFGIGQIEALINQDPEISQQISLWNTQGSRVLQGNLLVIPIEESLLYVEPLYLEAETNSVPTLARVIVVYENRIVMAPDLDQALRGLFAEPQTDSSALIRPLEAFDGALLEGVSP
ncbi:MAG: COG1615 family transporter [Spirulinaceae cyanobacterium RM2_2_10]|nr:COG1615 family transporter [Spirulinaceae cyanobacterium SM2_1_0]NJO20973.1 COG1615 family transporter [Spirulinaceae cyanobacterium RM2_2_10]